MIAPPPHTHRSDVLHSSEGQKNEKSGSVVNHCWPWLQVIKALLSFCQSSDSTNISPWLISAVFSVQFIPSPEKINTQPLCSLYTCAFLDIILLACRLCIITNVSSSLKARNSVSSVQKRVFLRVENLLSRLMGIFWFCRVVLQLKLSPFWFLGSTTWTLNRSRVRSSNCHLSGFLLLWCTPWMRMGIWMCDKGGLGQRQVCRCHAAS